VDVECVWVNRGMRTPNVGVECSVYMWVVLPGIEVAHSECIVDVSGCILLRIEVAKINGWRAHNIDFNCMTSS